MRTWVDDRKKRPVDKRWVMRCEGKPAGMECTTTSEPFETQPDLEVFRDRGWFIAAKSGDLCPSCREAGLERGHEPHRIMATAMAGSAGGPSNGC